MIKKVGEGDGFKREFRPFRTRDDIRVTTTARISKTFLLKSATFHGDTKVREGCFRTKTLLLSPRSQSTFPSSDPMLQNVFYRYSQTSRPVASRQVESEWKFVFETGQWRPIKLASLPLLPMSVRRKYWKSTLNELPKRFSREMTHTRDR